MTPQEFNEMLKKATPDIQALNYPQPIGPQSRQNAPGETLVEVFAQESANESGRVKLNLALSKSADELKLNKTEAQWLAILRTRGYRWLGIQALTFKIGDDCRYTPDFAAVTADGKLLIWEVKGFMRDDAQVKIKVAARAIFWAQFFLVKKVRGEFSESPIRS